MRILIVNDDGINAVGINVLAEVFAQNNDIVMVAPSEERSGFAHSITMHTDIEVIKVDRPYEAYAISGTPADCVKIALTHLFKDDPPALILSGINNGPNLGTDIYYSGTVAAAIEGAHLGIKSIAMSLQSWNADRKHFEAAALFLKERLHAVLPLFDGANAVMNINYPVLQPYAGFKAAKAGVNWYFDSYLESKNRGFLRITGVPRGDNGNDDDCDVELIKKGYATLTPINLDRTDYAVLANLKKDKLFD